MLRRFGALFKALILTVAIAAAGPFTGAAQAQEMSKPDEQAIQKIIRAYLLENPEVIAEAIAVLRDRQEIAQAAAAKEAVRANQSRLLNDLVSPVLGNPNGDVTITEFYDYQCPFCRRGHTEVLRLLSEDSGLRVVYKQFPVKDVPGEEPGSLIAARMAIVISRHGNFVEFHKAAMTAPMPLTAAKLFAIAERLGVDMFKLRQEMNDSMITDSIRDNMFLAQEIGVTGTPTYVIGDEVIVGAVGYDVLKEAIANTRREKAASTSSP